MLRTASLHASAPRSPSIRTSSSIGTLCLGCAFALLAAPMSVARAECVEDSDCGRGHVCELDDDAVVDCPPGQSCPMPPDETVEGECVGAPCSEDGDCPNGFGCDLGGGGQVSPACPGDGECPEPEPTPEPEGRCEPQPIVCEDDAGCPTGLTCVEDDGGSSSSGVCESNADGTENCEETPEPEPEPAKRACGYALMECEQDSDCTQAGYACITTQGVSHCSSGPCSADGQCPDEVCESSEVRLCFPERVDCTDDSDCDEGWLCFMLTDDQLDSPVESYEGATDVCWPEGIVLAITEQIELADVDAEGGDGRSAAEGEGGKALAGDDAADGDARSSEPASIFWTPPMRHYASRNDE
jgi:hypothetical protein